MACWLACNSDLHLVGETMEWSIIALNYHQDFHFYPTVSLSSMQKVHKDTKSLIERNKKQLAEFYKREDAQSANEAIDLLFKQPLIKRKLVFHFTLLKQGFKFKVVEAIADEIADEMDKIDKLMSLKQSDNSDNGEQLKNVTQVQGLKQLVNMAREYVSHL